MSVPPVLGLVTLGVRDVAAATAFYERLGWPLSPASVPGDVSFFRTAGATVALWGDESLRADTAAPANGGTAFRGVALAINLPSREDVDAGLAAAVAAGGSIARPAEATDWGGYNGYFADLDGHLWELAHNPHWPLDERGLAQLP
ncbi:MAG: VOC family protein [Jatrophihabitans sp.]|uniref:VOC family protein n=1 Tax=Jatrophihabitans sp. TaxID=1932789 RepID=UPI003F7FFDE2